MTYRLLYISAAAIAVLNEAQAQAQTITLPITLEGFIQTDLRAFPADPDHQYLNEFTLRRIRVGVSGSLNQFTTFRIVPDFAGSRIVLTDAYVELKGNPAFKLRAGKFKVPLGLERSQTVSNNLFVEQNIANVVVPNYDIGVQLHGEVFRSRVYYAVGSFNGVVDGASGDGGIVGRGTGKDIAGRLLIRLFSGPGTAVAIGGGATTGSRRGTTGTTALGPYRTVGSLPIFSYASSATAAGNITRHGLHGHAYRGPLGFLAELAQSRQAVADGASEDPTARRDVRVRAKSVQVSYMLTQDRATFGTVAPRKPFGAQGFGAFEVAARVEQFDVASNFGLASIAAWESSKEATSLTSGLNWYLTSAVKLQINYETTTFKRSSRPIERAILTRLQAVF
jgi:phosphate-selective porin OprO and OprP